jgi:hypothetical protein
MFRAEQMVRLVVSRNDRHHWNWQIFMGVSPIAVGASDKPFVSKHAAQAAGKLAMRKLAARQQDQRAFDRYSKLQRGTPGLDRKIRFFVGKRIDRLLRAAAHCNDVYLQAEFVRMAECWMREEPGDGSHPAT